MRNTIIFIMDKNKIYFLNIGNPPTQSSVICCGSHSNRVGEESVFKLLDDGK